MCFLSSRRGMFRLSLLAVVVWIVIAFAIGAALFMAPKDFWFMIASIAVMVFVIVNLIPWVAIGFREHKG